MNVRATLNTLLEFDTIPIINENDTVATQEIRYGDNDQLAARVAHLLEADVLILLSDIDGLYSSNPLKILVPFVFNADIIKIEINSSIAELLLKFFGKLIDFKFVGVLQKISAIFSPLYIFLL